MDFAPYAAWDVMGYVLIFIALFIPLGYLLEYTQDKLIGGKMDDLPRKRRLYRGHSLVLASTFRSPRDTQPNSKKVKKSE